VKLGHKGVDRQQLAMLRDLIVERRELASRPRLGSRGGERAVEQVGELHRQGDKSAAEEKKEQSRLRGEVVPDWPMSRKPSTIRFGSFTSASRTSRPMKPL